MPLYWRQGVGKLAKGFSDLEVAVDLGPAIGQLIDLLKKKTGVWTTI
jgi:hypothetical protein